MEEVVGRAGVEIEMERDAVRLGAELGLRDSETRLTDEDCPPSAGS